HTVVKVGQIVKVKVIAVDEALKRISLSMKTEDMAPSGDKKVSPATATRPVPAQPQKKPQNQTKQQQQPHHHSTLADLVKKFNG
ncbi:MAG: S1 RNA-binding domain-containing protein, partial [Fibrobacteres bacterium]|nr:S1 RNA-binding domain-containing protein [Fibrobacterota bacterium]